MRLLAISDLRIQPLRLLEEVVAQVQPDLVIYGGDDVARFGRVRDETYARMALECVARADASDGQVQVAHPRALFGHAWVEPWKSGPLEGWHVWLGLMPGDEWGRVSLVASRTPNDGARLKGARRVTLDGQTWWIGVQPPKLHGPHEGSWSRLLAGVPGGLVGVLGNDGHPLHADILRQPPCHDLGHRPVIVDDLALIGLPGAPKDEEDAKGIGAVLFTKDEARRHLEGQIAAIGDLPFVLVSHTPPKGVLDHAIRYGAASIGSSVVREVLRHPQAVGVVCGHVHRQGGRFEEVDGASVVNIASHDHDGASMRYAVLEWDGSALHMDQMGEVHDHQPLRRIHGLGGASARRLAEHGIRTAEDVLDANPADLADWTRTAKGTGGLGRSGARLVQGRAQAILDEQIVVCDFDLELPDKYVVIDVESSDKQDDPWLVGALVAGTDELVQFEQLDPERHAEQLDALGELLDRHPQLPIIQWGHTDRSTLRKAWVRSGRAEELPEWMRKSRWLDLARLLPRHLAFPLTKDEWGRSLCGMNLKRIANLLDFAWRDPEMTGREVGLAYGRYRARGEAFDVEKVRLYNADDVQATAHVLERVRSLIRTCREESLPRLLQLIDDRPHCTVELSRSLAISRPLLFDELRRWERLGVLYQVDGQWHLG